MGAPVKRFTLYKARAVPEAALLPPSERLVEGQGLASIGQAHGQAGAKAAKGAPS